VEVQNFSTAWWSNLLTWAVLISRKPNSSAMELVVAVGIALVTTAVKMAMEARSFVRTNWRMVQTTRIRGMT
jgi:hypothetical protein